MGPTGRVGRPPDCDSDRTRQQIVAAARARFARDGYRATTNKLIAGDVGITTAAIYHYVDSKAALYAAVYCDTIERVYDEFEKAAAQEDHLLARYSAVLRRANELQTEDASISGFIVAVAQETRRHPDLLTLIAPQRGRHQRFFARLVSDAQATGELQPDVDEAALADLLGAVLTGLAHMTNIARDAGRYTAAVDVLERFFDGSLVSLR